MTTLGTNLPGLKEWLEPDYQPFVDAMKSAPKPMAIKSDGTLDWARSTPLELDENGYPTKATCGTRLTLPFTPHGYGYRAFASDGGGSLPTIKNGNMLHWPPVWDEIQYNPLDVAWKNDTFRPQFLEALKDRGVIRFMDWQKTNNSGVHRWSDRSTPKYVTQNVSHVHGNPQGVALEYMLELAETLDVAAWFCMPDQADENYIRNFALLCKASNVQKFYIEHSNEIWNSLFKQYHRAWAAGGHAFGIDVAESTGRTNRFLAAMVWHGWRTLVISKIFREVFADQPDRIHITLGCGFRQTNSWRKSLEWEYPSTYTSDMQPQSRAAAPTERLVHHVDSIAVAFYFGGYLGNSGSGTFRARNINPETLSVDQVVSECRWHMTDIEGRARFVAGEAASHGLPLFAYEGGHHLDVIKFSSNKAENDRLKNKVDRVFADAVQTSHMADLYHDMLAAWDRATTPAASGSPVFCLFTGPGIGTRGNYFSMSPGDPRYQGVSAYLESRGNIPTEVPQPTPEPEPSEDPTEPYEPTPTPTPTDEPTNGIADRLTKVDANLVEISTDLSGIKRSAIAQTSRLENLAAQLHTVTAKLSDLEELANAIRNLGIPR